MNLGLNHVKECRCRLGAQKTCNGSCYRG